MSNTNPGAYAADRPNRSGKATLGSPGVCRFFNTSAFVVQSAGTLGDERSNQLCGPHNRRLDASIFKNVSIGNEANLQFRAGIFEVPNTATFGSPDAASFKRRCSD